MPILTAQDDGAGDDAVLWVVIMAGRCEVSERGAMSGGCPSSGGTRESQGMDKRVAFHPPGDAVENSTHTGESVMKTYQDQFIVIFIKCSFALACLCCSIALGLFLLT